jgi:WD40 repeat protein
VEVAHEALLSHWERLRTWIDDRRDDLVLHRRLVAAVDEWRAAGQRTEYLVTGGRLDHFESFAGDTDLAIGAEESAYLIESRRHSDELATRRRRRRRSIMAGFAVAAVIAAVLAVVALIAQRRAEDATVEAQHNQQLAQEEAARADEEAVRADGERVRAEQEADRAEREALVARARDLASSAVAAAESDPLLAMNLAVLAVETLPEGEEPGPALESALRTAKAADRSAGRYDELDAGLWTNADLSPDGSMVAVAHGQQLVVFDSATMEAELWSYREPGPEALAAVVYSSDGQYIVASVVDERDRSFFLTEASDADGSPDPRLLVFQADSGELVHTQVVEVEGACVAWAWPGSWRSDLGLLGLAVHGCDWEGLAFQFVDTTWEVVYQHPIPPNDLGAVVFGREGTLAAMFSGFNLGPRSWLIDTADWSIVRELDYPMGALSPDGAVVAGTAYGPGPVRLEDATTGVLIDSLPIGDDFGFVAAFSPAGDIFAIGTFSESTLLFDPATGELIDTIQPVAAITMVLGENHLYLAESGVVSKWNTTDVGLGDLNTVPLGLYVGYNSILWTPDGTVVADVLDTTTMEWSLYPVDSSTGDLGDPIPCGSATTWLAPLPGDRVVMFRFREAASGVIEHGPLEVVDLSTGEFTVIAGCWMEQQAALAHEPCPNGDPHPAGQIALQGSRDGTEFMILDLQETEAGETEVVASIWDTSTFTETSRLSLGVQEGSFLRDSRFNTSLFTEDYIVLHSDRDHAPQVRDRATGELLLEVGVSGNRTEHDRAQNRIWFTDGADSKVSLLDLDTLELRPVTGRVAETVWGVATSPSGELVAAASSDGNLRVYTDEGELRHSIPLPNPSDAWWLDEETLVVGTQNGPWTVITLDFDRLLAAVKASLREGFTDAECSLYEIDPCPTLEELQGG